MFLQPVPNVIGPSVHTSGTKDIQIVSFESTGAMGHIVSDMADLQQLILGKLLIPSSFNPNLSWLSLNNVVNKFNYILNIYSHIFHLSSNFLFVQSKII